MKDENPGTGPAHVPGARKGEELVQGKGTEPGRESGDEDQNGRVSGTSTARISTGVNPEMEESITETPAMPPA